MADMDEAKVESLIADNAPYLVAREDGRIECTLNNHCLPARIDAIESFINGKKFKKLLKQQDLGNSLKKYEPFISPSINFPDMLFCALTNQLVGKSVDGIKKHMAGKRFQRAQERFQKDEMELYEEPDLEAAIEAEEEEDVVVAAGGGAAGGKGGEEEEPDMWIPPDELIDGDVEEKEGGDMNGRNEEKEKGGEKKQGRGKVIVGMENGEEKKKGKKREEGKRSRNHAQPRTKRTRVQS